MKRFLCLIALFLLPSLANAQVPAPVLTASTTYNYDAITLIWDEPVDAAASFLLERDTVDQDGLNWKDIAVFNGGQYYFNDTSVHDGTTYEYRIAAFDAAGNMSDWSNVVVATAP
jgi:hypothetical protein